MVNIISLKKSMLAVLITLTVIFTMSIVMAQEVKAADPYLIENPEIYVNHEPRLEVRFDLGESINLADGYSNIIYEYFIDGVSTKYIKNRTWGGYLNSYDDDVAQTGEHKYSKGSDSPSSSDTVPATRIYTSIKSNSTISDVKAVTAVKVTVLRADGSGETVMITCNIPEDTTTQPYTSRSFTRSFISAEPTSEGTAKDIVNLNDETIDSLRDWLAEAGDEGKVIEVVLTVDYISENTLTAEESSALADALSSLGVNQTALILDISLDKIVNGNTTPISEIPGDNKITLVIDIPLEYQKSDHVFSLIHILKDGTTEILPDLDTNPATITVEIGSFSPFVLVSKLKQTTTDNSSLIYWMYINQMIGNQKETPKVTLDADLTYTGKEQTPDPVVKSGSTTLKENTDYTLTYDDNTNAGTATVTVKFKGSYSQFASQTVEFKIAPATLTATFVDETISLGETPDLEIKVTGFVNDETAKTAKGYTAPEINVYIPEREGTFKVTPAGGKAANYTFEYVTGYVTVTAPVHGTCYYENFTDLGSKYESAHKAIDYVVGNGYFKGVSATEFDPSGSMNRAMIPTVLGRISKISETPIDDCGFTDVDTAKFSWATAAIKWGYDNDIVKGTDVDKFSPADDVTIEQAVTFIYRYVQFTGADVTLKGNYDISTYEISEYAGEAMTWAYANSMISEIELANANQSASRILFAEMLYAISSIIG